MGVMTVTDGSRDMVTTIFLGFDRVFVWGRSFCLSVSVKFSLVAVGWVGAWVAGPGVLLFPL